MLIHPMSREATQEMYPNGRKYLFDLGTGRYLSGSLPWFNAIYSLRGIEFDEVWGEFKTLPTRFALKHGLRLTLALLSLDPHRLQIAEMRSELPSSYGA